MRIAKVTTFVGLMFLFSGACSAQLFDGRWEGILLPNERCKDGTIEFEMKDNRITSGSLQGTIPGGRVNSGPVASVEPVGSDGKMKILIGTRFPGELMFAGNTFHATFATPNCAQRQAKGERK